jgi:hypothetical protein
MPSAAAGATAEAAVVLVVAAEVAVDSASVAAEVAVDSAAVAAAVHFVVAVEAVHFAEAEATAAFEAAVDLAEASGEDTAAMVGDMVTVGVIGADTASVLAGAGQATGPVTPTILTIMDTPPIMVIRVITDTIRTLTADMVPPDHTLQTRPRLL